MSVTEYGGRVFDRVERWDARNAEHPLQLLAETPGPPLMERELQARHWKVPDVLDQGTEGACTGFGTAHMLSSTPRGQKDVTGVLARKLYREAQKLDEWAGEDYEGSSVTGAMKAAKAAGRIRRYVWPRTAREVAVAVGYFGPVVIGVDWHERMMDTDASGYVHADGRTVGGHCVALVGYKVINDTFTVVNSWGEDWGRGGYAWLTGADLDRLLGAGGDAALATKV